MARSETEFDARGYVASYSTRRCGHSVREGMPISVFPDKGHTQIYGEMQISVGRRVEIELE